MPLPDLSTENLRYLTAEQALADYADFIQFIKKTVLYNDPFVETRFYLFFFSFINFNNKTDSQNHVMSKIMSQKNHVKNKKENGSALVDPTVVIFPPG